MRITSLIRQLQFLRQHYGDLECVVGEGDGIGPMAHPKVRMLCIAESGLIPRLVAGDRVSVMCAGSGPP